MKNIDFKIKVVNKQRIDNSIEEICEEAEGMFSIKNSITVDGDVVTVKRSGNTSSNIVLDRRKKTEFKYNTMYGIIDVIADTKKIVNALDEKGGKLRLVYTLIMQGAKIENDMEIAVWRNVDEVD